ncbi:14944_t:CDS:2 [Dentiscutata heterogama]|uniref:14944_t:CDS:1 n=1 Tax=Dentiscutata heterogama TaxID=1316150 RepID=A0ACA9KAE3_9GLOM|nr:14944_t:CDS:2 [Dentiscutata heterogama]
MIDSTFLDIDLGENKDYGTDDDVEEILDTLISFVQENNKKLEWVASNMVYAETGEVTDLIEELTDLIDEQRDKIAKCLFHQKLEKNNVLTEKFMTMERNPPKRIDTTDFAGWINASLLSIAFTIPLFVDMKLSPIRLDNLVFYLDI